MAKQKNGQIYIDFILQKNTNCKNYKTSSYCIKTIQKLFLYKDWENQNMTNTNTHIITQYNLARKKAPIGLAIHFAEGKISFY